MMILVTFVCTIGRCRPTGISKH
ncbi:hypothetical protein MTR67_007762 [Solanum verrucosum]|uniref:Uncharacterized protein n=1 Tax=Solanum verrucosum TaxID=315347 RepID=A0AAF0TBC4_SOLVR|nr:hypothetical protein MTR67_007762 [Solanum verrucosum]